jgi:hypothetical protein
MQVTADNPAYIGWRVRLDGEDLPNCFFADDQIGLALVYVEDTGPRSRIWNPLGRVAVEMLRGDVTLIPPLRRAFPADPSGDPQLSRRIG